MPDASGPPKIDLATWKLRIFGLVGRGLAGQTVEWNWEGVSMRELRAGTARRNCAPELMERAGGAADVWA